MDDVAGSMRSSMVQGTASTGNTNTTQVNARSWLQQLVALLNTRAGDRYMFSGRATDQPPIETYDHIINGDGGRAGLTQIISERSQADLGTSGLGRLMISTPTATSVQLDEDAVSPFGFKLNAVSSGLSNATVTGPAGSPASLNVDFTGLPSDGEKITVTLDLPDGTTTNLTLTATTTSPPGDNEFTIGASAAATATNLQSTLNTALGTLANTTLKAASAVQAATEFFDADSSNPPLRVSGPPYDSATSLVAGTTSDSVIWYTGEVSGTSVRSSATARIDQSLVVSYGTRANETGIRNLVQSVATRAALTVSPSDPNAANLIAALDNRLTDNINGTGGAQTVTDIEADLAGVQTSLQAVKTNHRRTSNTLGSFLQEIQGVSNEEVGTKLLALQTRMQASMQTTSLLYRISLVNYL
jgi:flagellin-like hook-associated protein FlgL